MKKSTLLLILLLVTFIGNATQSSDTTKLQKLKSEFGKERKTTYSKYLTLDTLAKRSATINYEEFKTNIALEKQKRLQIDDENFAMKHRWRSFDFQYTASIIIFFVVIIIVISGLVFSGWQFNHALKQMKLKEKIVDHAAATTTNQDNVANNFDWASLSSQLEVSTTGVKVNSSLLGVIILALSIAFFYLYIIYVYPIKYVSAPAATEVTTEKAKTPEAPAK